MRSHGELFAVVWMHTCFVTTCTVCCQMLMGMLHYFCIDPLLRRCWWLLRHGERPSPTR